MDPIKKSRNIALIDLNVGTRQRWVVNFTPRPLSPVTELRYPLSMTLGERFGEEKKLLPQPAFEPRIVQPVV